MKAAILILADTDQLARTTNALQAAKEFKDEGDDVEVIFDGAATQWIGRLEDEDHQLHGLYTAVKDDVGVCDFCAGAFDADGPVDESGVERLDEYHGHPSVRTLAAEGYEVITF